VSLPALNPHPPARQLTPLSIAHVPPQVEEHALPTVPNAPATGVNETADFDAYTARAARWPEDSGHNAQPVVAEAQPEAVTEDPPAAPPPPPVLPVETVIPTPPQPVPSVAERLAMAATTPIAQTVETMMASGERIGDPGIIIERFIAREELVAMPLPERRGFLPGEVTTQELSASLGPDLTVLKGDSRSKLLDDYRVKVRAHLAGLKPPGGFGSDTIVVGFTITRSGKVSSAKILESRGIYHLEQGTLNAVYAAAPFPQPPRDLKGTKFEFAIPFRFE
jgi:TonB family protein